ncbi:MAG: decarboxylating NADP(+)-dependent phosphogluconate dehydrogenase [Bacteroides sp.]|nr:decarboxylating NADP(+)-dependent phosphogluconate dehydrogenase [Roseburia sp.]MCM1345639.1 decarboxylating NADP(+)-dependent phosphogluconate dehydrogenase [Bacteroides sp.]MCM1420943.1 decarboxylating NADP(+)-dependent phosphogluconate dehydrogenase [Bacteroides sp.]
MAADIGIIGLGVMGKALARNMESKGLTVAVYNRFEPGREDVADKFVSDYGTGNRFVPAHSLSELAAALSVPRVVMLMVSAGNAVDEMIEQLCPCLSFGDVIIDGGNSDFRDTQRRGVLLEQRGIHYIGCGVSGGEDGALRGPSVMPGGSLEGWRIAGGMLRSMAARLDDGTPCCEWIGNGGSGHFVKTVHNGIEYGDMQLIAEAYTLLRKGCGLGNMEMADVFARWNVGQLDSFLIKITAGILRKRDADGSFLVDNILDVASQKGTGKWSVMASVDEDEPATLMAESVYARMLSAYRELRVQASRIYQQAVSYDIRKPDVEDVRKALYASKIISYAQGFSLMRRASEKYGWNLNLSTIARIWQNGCIIRSGLLRHIRDAYGSQPEMESILLDDYFVTELTGALSAWRRIVSYAALAGLPLPAMGSALSYFDGMRTLHSSANLIQAQRDCFGAHQYERVDCERGKMFHTVWDF